MFTMKVKTHCTVFPFRWKVSYPKFKKSNINKISKMLKIPQERLLSKVNCSFRANKSRLLQINQESVKTFCSRVHWLKSGKKWIANFHRSAAPYCNRVKWIYHCFCVSLFSSYQGVVNKWRHAVLDNVRHPPLPIVIHLITKALVLSSQNNLPPPLPPMTVT